MRVRKAVIPAAGLGTRFLPATKAQPKEMLPIVDKPTLQFIIEEAVASGIEEVIIDKSVELDMDEYSRIVIEQYCMSHKSKKSLQLRDLLNYPI
jgi:UTP--glucose-1-phosphate uridylyltransferase